MAKRRQKASQCYNSDKKNIKETNKEATPVEKDKFINIVAESFLHVLRTDMYSYGQDAEINKKILFMNFENVFFVFFGILTAYIFLDINISSKSIEHIIYSMHLYYVMMIAMNINYLNKIKDIIFNFLGSISLYNILLSLNPFNMLELSSSYMISNFLYYYISFLIFTSSYNFYEKITFVASIMAELFKENKINIILKLTQIFILWFLFSLLFILPINNNKYSISLILIINIILSLLIGSLFLFIIKKKKISHIAITKKLKENKKNINNLNVFFLNIFTINKINKHNKNKSIIYNSLRNILAIIRIFPLLILIPIIITNNYYTIYFKNKNECLNSNLEKISIIELKNNNVLIETFNNGKHYLKETSCKRAHDKFEINKINW